MSTASNTSMFRRKKITVVFTVKEEIVPGLFYDPQDFADKTVEDIKYRLSAYKPELVETKVEDDTGEQYKAMNTQQQTETQTEQKEQKQSDRRNKYASRNLELYQRIPAADIEKELSYLHINMPSQDTIDKTEVVEWYGTTMKAAEDYNLFVFVDKNGDEIATVRVNGY